MISHLNSFWYVEMDKEFIETPCQDSEVISLVVVEDVTAITKTTRVPHKMASLKDAKATIEEGVARSRASFLISPTNLTSLVLALLQKVKRLFVALELEALRSMSAMMESML